MSDYYGADTFEQPVQYLDLSKWTTEDGRVFKLTAMIDNHLANTIRFLEAKQVEDALADVPKGVEFIVSDRQTVRASQIAAMRAEALRRGLEIS